MFRLIPSLVFLLFSFSLPAQYRYLRAGLGPTAYNVFADGYAFTAEAGYMHKHVWKAGVAFTHVGLPGIGHADYLFFDNETGTDRIYRLPEGDREADAASSFRLFLYWNAASLFASDHIPSWRLYLGVGPGFSSGLHLGTEYDSARGLRYLRVQATRLWSIRPRIEWEYLRNGWLWGITAGIEDGGDAEKTGYLALYAGYRWKPKKRE
ncbi:MAG: hypothetical protein GXO27_03080 [Chlorobi bacterium]|nr:hypothetical protein [Chlorobiota bacterium]